MIPGIYIYNMTATENKPKTKIIPKTHSGKYTINWILESIKLIVLVSIFGFSNIKHPFYLGVTDINYNTPSKRFEINIKLFANDMESVVSKEFNAKCDFLNGNQAENNLVLKKWIPLHFKMYNQNLSLKINYIGYEIQDELCWIYLETEPLEKEVKNIKVHQNMMYNFIKEQMHIVSFSYLNNTNSLKKINPEFKFEF